MKSKKRSWAGMGGAEAFRAYVFALQDGEKESVSTLEVRLDPGDKERAERCVQRAEMTVISADDAADLLKIHRTSLYSGAKNGVIPCRRIGRRFIFVRETLVAWALST